MAGHVSGCLLSALGAGMPYNWKKYVPKKNGVRETPPEHNHPPQIFEIIYPFSSIELYLTVERNSTFLLQYYNLILEQDYLLLYSCSKSYLTFSLNSEILTKFEILTNLELLTYFGNLTKFGNYHYI